MAREDTAWAHTAWSAIPRTEAARRSGRGYDADAARGWAYSMHGRARVSACGRPVTDRLDRAEWLTGRRPTATDRLRLRLTDGRTDKRMPEIL
eukprot:6272385-Prymnesium_polylepis.1